MSEKLKITVKHLLLNLQALTEKLVNICLGDFEFTSFKIQIPLKSWLELLTVEFTFSYLRIIP